MDDDIGRRQESLRGDFERLMTYGAAHRGTWAGMKFEGALLVALTTDPDADRADVLAAVEHPESVEVRRAAYSRSELDEVYAQVLARLDSSGARWSDHGLGLTAVRLGLGGGEDALAAELHGEFGDAVELTVGGHPWPLPTTLPAPPSAPRSSTQLADARFEVALTAPARVRSTVDGELRVTNTGDGVVDFSTDQPLLGVLLRSGRVAGSYSGWRTGTGLRVHLLPGAFTTIKFFVGTDSADPAIGTALPGGDYELVVVVPVDADGGREQVVTDPVPVRLTDG